MGIPGFLPRPQTGRRSALESPTPGTTTPGGLCKRPAEPTRPDAVWTATQLSTLGMAAARSGAFHLGGTYSSPTNQTAQETGSTASLRREHEEHPGLHLPGSREVSQINKYTIEYM